MLSKLWFLVDTVASTNVDPPPSLHPTPYPFPIRIASSPLFLTQLGVLGEMDDNDEDFEDDEDDEDDEELQYDEAVEAEGGGEEGPEKPDDDVDELAAALGGVKV